MNINIVSSILKNSIQKKIPVVLDRLVDNTILKRVTETAAQWKLDVKEWLSRVSSPATGQTSGPLMKTGQLRKAAGNYEVRKRPIGSKGAIMIEVTTRYGQVSSYSKNQKNTWNYSDILDETTGQYYSGYKDRYRQILYKRLERIINGRV